MGRLGTLTSTKTRASTCSTGASPSSAGRPLHGDVRLVRLPPRTLPHTFHSVGGPAQLLIIGTPGGLDEYFAALRVAAPEEHERIRETYGIVPG